MSVQQDQERPQARVNVRLMIAVGAIVAALGIAAGLTIHWFPPAASKQAGPIDTLWKVLLIVSIPVFVLVETVVVFSVWKFRMRPGEELLDGPPIHGNTRLEIVWTAIPAFLLVGLCTYAFLVLEDVEKAPANAASELHVRVVGQQFAWTFYYKKNGKEYVSPQLHVPINRSVQFTLQSKDVLHDFWVPAFRMKKDLVPGIDGKYRITPTRLGTYPIVCAELCGLGHSVMRGDATVQTQAAFNKWLDDLASGKTNTAGGQPQQGAGGGGNSGKAIFTSGTTNCASCHTLSDAGATGTIGPDLDKVLKGKNAQFIRTSIVNPNAFVEKGFPANVMPQTFGKTLQPAQIDALVKYLSDVTKGG